MKVKVRVINTNSIFFDCIFTIKTFKEDSVTIITEDGRELIFNDCEVELITEKNNTL